MFDGESATLRIERTISYPYTEPNSVSRQLEEKIGETPIGTVLKVKPKLQKDNKTIDLELEFEIRNLLGFEDGLPQTEIIRVKMHAMFAIGQTLVIGGHKISSKNEEDGQISQKEVLVLIKAERVKPEGLHDMK